MNSLLFVSLLAQSVPVPRDIPLPLPLPEWLLISVLIISFLLHILFVNLMVGGTALTFFYEWKGLKDPRYLDFAKEIGSTVTVNKSLAVVLGVAPLLAINTVYTLYFYSANALTGIFWISIIPLVIIAFLLTYWHKFSWKRFEGRYEKHVWIIGAATALFLFIPLIFLTNVNLMLFPEKWGEVEGFFSAMLLWNVIPRYFHFLTGTLALTGLFLFWYMGLKRYPFEQRIKGFSRYETRKTWMKVVFYVTLSNFIFGPLVFFTLPWHAMEWNVAGVIIAGVIIAAIALFIIYKNLKGPEERLGRAFPLIAVTLTVVVLCMGMGRHLYRKNALDEHQQLVKQKTEAFMLAVEQAKLEFEKNPEVTTIEYEISPRLEASKQMPLEEQFDAMEGIVKVTTLSPEHLIVVSYVNHIPDMELRIDKKIVRSGYNIDKKL